MNTSFLTFIIVFLLAAVVTVVIMDIAFHKADEVFREHMLDIMRHYARCNASLEKEFVKFSKMVPKLPPPPAPQKEQQDEEVPTIETIYDLVVRDMIPLLFDKKYADGMPSGMRQRLIITLRAALDAKTTRDLVGVERSWHMLSDEIYEWASQTLLSKP